MTRTLPRCLFSYVTFLNSRFRLAAPLTIICDCSNGSAGIVLKKLRVPRLTLRLINARPDGRFPAHGPDPNRSGAMTQLRKEVRRQRADLGVILDADGDRIFFMDATGTRLPADAVTLLLARNFPPPIVIDPRSAGWIFEDMKLQRVESQVGHYFIKKLMRRKRAAFGAEKSGHYYFRLGFGQRVAYYDSGLIALAYLATRAAELKKGGGTLSAWVKTLPLPAQIPETNFRSQNAVTALSKVERFYRSRAKRISRLDGLTVELPRRKLWFNLRASNTEAVLRLNAAAENKAVLIRAVQRIQKIIGA